MRKISALAAALALTITTAACGGGSENTFDASSGSDSIVVGSANFPENVILGELYSKALDDAGYTVTRRLNIGAREVIYDQVKSCALSVVPEYNQALLSFVAPKNEAQGTQKVDAALAKALPDTLRVLDSASAQDNNSVVVTKQTAEKYDLAAIPDLKGVSEDMVFGGPTEWKSRADGYAGLGDKYGVTFKEYRVLDYSGPITISALDHGDIDAALLFSTTPQIAQNDYLVLDDPQTVVGVNNIIPLACKSALDDKAAAVLNEISANLTTEDLTAMNKAYSVDKEDAKDVAADWLSDHPVSAP